MNPADLDRIDNHSHLKREWPWLDCSRAEPNKPVYVCLCNGVTEREIREVAAAGCRSVAELTMRTGCGASCGSCLDTAAEVIDEVRNERSALVLPVLTHAA